MWTLVNQENYFEAVIGSGKAYSIKTWIETCFQLKGMSWEPYVSEKEDFVSQYKILVSNPQLIKSLGWQAKIEIQQLASMMIGI